MSQLFTPLTIRGLTFKNRLAMSPMCMYSSRDGLPVNFHFAHYGSRAMGGCGAIVQEATAVAPEGRITDADMGIWDDKHVPALKRIIEYVKAQGVRMGIQLGHAGRKASTNTPHPGHPERQLKEGPGAWPTLSASAIPFRPDDNPPKAMTDDDIRDLVDKFRRAAIRAVEAGYEFIEIHGAHGYLLTQFLSPLTNKRTDNYGGSFENRVRLLLEIAETLRRTIPDAMPLWTRISAVEWVEDGWNLDDSVRLAALLRERGVDLIDASSGGNMPSVSIPAAPGYQVPFAERIRRETGMPTAAVGLITEAKQAEEIVAKGQADLVVLGRQLLRDPFFPLRAAYELGAQAEWPVQYYRAKWGK